MTRREQILESAFNAFTSKGIKVVKMEDIAGSLKISKKTLYEFFSGKKELLVASMEYK
ncbi:MAG: TetR/AcrR family transcriptional regulator, partial [Bacteroidales bacterium]|nr:TetR/AcrR family transcriptional regulator [Bacteroidales bacterium]